MMLIYIFMIFRIVSFIAYRNAPFFVANFLFWQSRTLSSEHLRVWKGCLTLKADPANVQANKWTKIRIEMKGAINPAKWMKHNKIVHLSCLERRRFTVALSTIRPLYYAGFSASVIVLKSHKSNDISEKFIALFNSKNDSIK